MLPLILTSLGLIFGWAFILETFRHPPTLPARWTHR